MCQCGSAHVLDLEIEPNTRVAIVCIRSRISFMAAPAERRAFIASTAGRRPFVIATSGSGQLRDRHVTKKIQSFLLISRPARANSVRLIAVRGARFHLGLFMAP